MDYCPYDKKHSLAFHSVVAGMTFAGHPLHRVRRPLNITDTQVFQQLRRKKKGNDKAYFQGKWLGGQDVTETYSTHTKNRKCDFARECEAWWIILFFEEEKQN